MNDHQYETDFDYAPARQVASSSVQAADLPASAHQLARALAHLVLGGAVLWPVAAAACLAQSL
jgi:hypothetical protein